MGLEADLIRMKDEYKKVVEIYEAKIAGLTRKLKADGSCKHKSFKDYTWQHDEGFGVLRLVRGRECNSCGKTDLWNNGKYANVELT